MNMWGSASVKIPTHIAVIPDGNRRYAKKQAWISTTPTEEAWRRCVAS
jgi:Undecaprenyl pyrophosphate synthetase (EC 2.5.1.31)